MCTMLKKIIVVAAIVSTLFTFGAPFAYAVQQTPELDVTPVVIDEKGKPRDILKQSIKVINTSERKLQLYPSVNDVHKIEGEKEFVAAQTGDDRKDSLANWIELSRGVIELGPGEEKEIPFVIRINVTAVAGSYHATISFTEGGARDAADAKPPLGEITVNVEVQDDVKEIMQLNKFGTDSFFLAGDDVLFNYSVENIGNQELQPKGEVRIYNRRGEEVAAVPVNSDGKTISPSQMTQLASVWSGAEGFGRYKAFLTVDYGKVQTASVQDTVYFWIVPWKQLLMLIVVTALMLLVFAFYFHRWFEARHLAKLAHAGFHVVQKDVQVNAPVIPVPGAAVSHDEIMERTGILFAIKSGMKKMIPRRRKKEVTAVPSVFPQEPISAPTPVVQPVMPAPQYSPTAAPVSESGTINLKALKTRVVQAPAAPQAQPPRVSVETNGHTISLKKMQ
jgi:hypothetical protein